MAASQMCIYETAFYNKKAIDHQFRMRIDVKFFMTLGHLDEKYTVFQTRLVK
jgi:hypothetical protein